MQKIRVLLYTDRHHPQDASRNMTLKPADPIKAPFGLSLMKELILAQIDKGIDVEIDLVNRNVKDDVLDPGSQKLTRKLLKGYEELWVFGQFQIAVPGKYDYLKGGPLNELDDEEVKALREWMDAGGGVLITGDHSEENPLEGKSDLLNLGRALGHRIPRAGEVRVWEGGPGSGESRVNTQSPGPSPNIELDSLEKDGEPQHIILEPDRTKFPGESNAEQELIESKKVDDLFRDAFAQALNIHLADIKEQEPKIHEAFGLLPADSLRLESAKSKQEKENKMSDFESDKWRSITVGKDTGDLVFEGKVVITDTADPTKVMVKHPKHFPPGQEVEGTINNADKTIVFIIKLDAAGTSRQYEGTVQKVNGDTHIDFAMGGKYTELTEADDDGGWVATRPPGTGL